LSLTDSLRCHEPGIRAARRILGVGRATLQREMTLAPATEPRPDLRYPSQIRASGRAIPSLIAPTLPFGTILAWIEDPDRLSSQLLRMQTSMENNENKPFWGKNSPGFWLIVCLTISALAGWVMFHVDILR